MSQILLITSDPRLESHSTKVARSLAEQLASRAPNSTLTVRDLTREPLPDKGPEELIKGEKVYLILARGGVYSEGPMQQFKFQDTYLRAALTFLGVTDVEMITIEGVAFGPEAADRAVSAALAKVSTVAA